MKKTWFNRLLLSYVPVIFVTTTILIFISVSIISDRSIKETEKANGIFSKYVIDSMDSSLHNIEQMILEEIGSRKSLNDFFEPIPLDDPKLVNYEASKELDKMIREYPMIHSIYLYREQDQTVIARSMIAKLDDFEDKDFILHAYREPQQFHWYPVREYKQFSNDPSQKVLTLTKMALLPFGKQGIVVVNVNVDSLLGIVDQMMNKDITFMEIRSGDQLVYPAQPSAPAKGEIVTRMHSDYIGWDFASGLKAGKFFLWSSFISRIWFVLGLLTIGFSIFYIVFVTRRNYKPIENIIEQIQSFQLRNEWKGHGNDEFAFIGKVLGKLADDTQAYEKQYREDLLLRRKQFFVELIEGKKSVSAELWHEGMSRFNLQAEYRHLAFAIIEIDRYRAFQEKYNQNDQQLMKFALTNAIHEFCLNDRQSVWVEWLSGQRLAALFISNTDEDAAEANRSIWDVLEKYRIWVAVNLKFSITAGFGGTTDEISGVHSIYNDSITALQFKMSLGDNQVISLEAVQSRFSNDTTKYVQMVNAMVQDFRIASPAWEEKLEQLYYQLKQETLKDADLRFVLHYLLRLFHRELEGMMPKLALEWKGRVHPALLQTLEEAETLEAVGAVFVPLLKELFASYASIRVSNTSHHLIANIRKYIEENYANPDLSLNHISDKFAINGKYASQLFKEAFGMKFVEFLVTLRMERAKELLVQTDKSITDISTEVGYVHAISFGRTFKKVVGVTPGDFRKCMGS